MSDVISLRLPEDLRIAVETAAQTEGVTTSEWIRAMLFKLVYDEPLGASEGYIEGRRIGYGAMLTSLRDAASKVPKSIDEATKLVRRGNPKG